ncbi:hypothetical protein [Hydrocarboniphaga effusa]|jgi:hypothetical protein|uniref:hypothetical protein n=1 Tax=Hydrocarboniphaga effusa TaxID=243629 RepID=UPI0035B0184F
MKIQPARVLAAIFLAASASHAWAVSQSDCVQEQEAFLQAVVDKDIPPKNRSSLPSRYVQEREDMWRNHYFSGAETNDSIAWHIADTRNIRNARDAQAVIESLAKFMQKDQVELDTFQARPYQGGCCDNRFSPETYQEGVAKKRMQICFFEARKNELSGGASAASASPSPAAVAECGAAQSASINSTLEQIDQRLARFLETPAGKQIGTATPMLQAVMWGTSQQANALRECANAEAFKKRLTELDAAFDSAKQACVQIQSRPDICGPVAPEDLTQ